MCQLFISELHTVFNMTYKSVLDSKGTGFPFLFDALYRVYIHSTSSFYLIVKCCDIYLEADIFLCWSFAYSQVPAWSLGVFVSQPVQNALQFSLLFNVFITEQICLLNWSRLLKILMCLPKTTAVVFHILCFK